MSDQIPLPGIEIQDLHTNVLNQDLQLYVKRPWSYEQSKDSYPILYCLDANRSFPLYSTTSLIFETPGTNAREMLIVGIGYKVDSCRIRGLSQWAAWRTRDLTPVRREDVETSWEERLHVILGDEKIEVRSGGAEKFLLALRNEVIPFIEEHYRVSQTDRGLAGYSYGGLFTLYTLFQSPQLFRRYFAGSPSIWWGGLFDYEDQYASTHADLEAKLFITAGGMEAELITNMQQMVDRLHSRNYPGLFLRTQVFEGENHSSAYPAAVSRALRVLYYENG
jgi:predicted alpha/beta superfamily hydrolase